MIGAGIDTDERLSHIRARQTALLNVNRALLGQAAEKQKTGLILGLAMGGLAAVAGAAYAIASYGSRRGFGLVEAGIHYDDKPGDRMARAFTYRWRHLPSGKSGTKTIYAHGVRSIEPLIQKWNAQQPDAWTYDSLGGAGGGAGGGGHDWRYAPKTVFVHKGGGERPVVRAVVHPPHTHTGSAIDPNMKALQLITDTGHSRWFGVDDAKINSELKMVARGGFINPRNELARAWKPCRVRCAGLAGA